MKVRVLLFARYAEVAGVPELRIEVPEGITLGGLWDEVRRHVPALSPDRAPLMAIDRRYAPEERIVGPDQEVAYFPPVSGG